MVDVPQTDLQDLSYRTPRMSPAEFTVPDELVRRIARGSTSLSDAKRECDVIVATVPGTNASMRQALGVLVKYAKDHKERQQYGRFCGVLVVATALFGDGFIDRLNRERLLVNARPGPRLEAALVQLSDRLRRSGEQHWDSLRERVDTYATFNRLQGALAASAEDIAALRNRPFRYGRPMLALANWAFLRRDFDFADSPELDRFLDKFHNPEDVAAAVSAVIALANEARPLESADFTLPTASLELSPTCDLLLDHGRRVSRLAEIEKLIAVLGYRLHILRTGPPAVFGLSAPSKDIEYALRLGFIRADIGTGSSRLQVARRESTSPGYSVMAAVETLLDSHWDKLIEIVDPDTPRRRLLFRIPLLPELLENISKWRFYEDVVMEEKLTQELEIPMRVKGEDEWDLTDSLGLRTFQRAWRILRFLTLLDIAALRRHQEDTGVVGNTLIRVISRDGLSEILTAFGLTNQQVVAFLKLVAANVNQLGYLDVQYRPFLALNPRALRIEDKMVTTTPEIVYAPAIVASANILPNLQRAHGIRMVTNAEAFVAEAAEYIKTLFPRVLTNAALKLGAIKTDVDIVALGEDTLYLFECKHSMTPTGAHELRDLWRDINKGVSQLETAEKILRARVVDYLAGWFPGTDKGVAARVRFSLCVLCSHRVFSGLSIKGVPIRDHASLALTLGDATVTMGYSEDGKHVALERYRLRENNAVTPTDLDNYLSDEAIFFRVFEPFMRPYTSIDRLSESVTVAQESFVYVMESDEWKSRLEQLGAVRLADETTTLGPTQPPEKT